MVRQISPRELAVHIANGHPVYLLDVRQQWEHDTAALPDSLLIPLNELPARIADVVPPPGALVVAYCHHGVRSLTAATLLARQGHKNVASLAGGIDAWTREVDPSLQRY